MSAAGDRLLAAVLASAGAQIAAEQLLGALVWARNGARCYQRVDVEEDGATTAVLTITGLQAGSTVYELPGLHASDLT